MVLLSSLPSYTGGEKRETVGKRDVGLSLGAVTDSQRADILPRPTPKTAQRNAALFREMLSSHEKQKTQVFFNSYNAERFTPLAVKTSGFAVP